MKSGDDSEAKMRSVMTRQRIIYRNKGWRIQEMNSRRTEVVERQVVCVQRSCKMH